MIEKFNVLRYKQLFNKDRLDEGLDDKKEVKELWHYKYIIQAQILYDRRSDYFLLIQNYLDKTIDIDCFRSKLKNMAEEDDLKVQEILENFQELENFYLDKDLDKFADLLLTIMDTSDEIYEVCDVEIGRMEESEFYDVIYSDFVQLQKAFPIK